MNWLNRELKIGFSLVFVMLFLLHPLTAGQSILLGIGCAGAAMVLDHYWDSLKDFVAKLMKG